ncbi:MAG TPA: cycloisomerase, partial [Gammaproteobacteria bacterium]|nr:cycloisomerase [Gammaproteobacteria bacterium]
VDDRYFYAVDNRAIAKYDKAAGKLVKRWQAAAGAPITHLDSAMLMGGKLYAAHSNYPGWPMTSSVEVFDASTLEHVDSHSFGVRWGSLTWIDWHDGHWWLGFANYDQRIGPGGTPYGGKANTVVIEMTEGFEPVHSWTLPQQVLDRFDDMSNSGGSWGPDGFLYLTGHDTAEVYRMTAPAEGSALELVEIVPLGIRGQGIAWDRSQPNVLYGIARATAVERAAGIGNRVTVSRILETQ